MIRITLLLTPAPKPQKNSEGSLKRSIIPKTGISCSESSKKNKSKSGFKILLSFLILLHQDCSQLVLLTRLKKMSWLWPVLLKMDLFPNFSTLNQAKWKPNWESLPSMMLWNGKKSFSFPLALVLLHLEVICKKSNISWKRQEMDKM